MSQDKEIDPKGASPEDLTKTTNKGSIELTEEELRKASGGLKIKMQEVFITSTSLGGSKGE